MFLGEPPSYLELSIATALSLLTANDSSFLTSFYPPGEVVFPLCISLFSNLTSYDGSIFIIVNSLDFRVDTISLSFALMFIVGLFLSFCAWDGCSELSYGTRVLDFLYRDEVGTGAFSSGPPAGVATVCRRYFANSID